MRPRIAYLLLETPRYSESFILNELLSLHDRGRIQRLYIMRGDAERLPRLPTELKEITHVLGDSSQEVLLSLKRSVGIYENNPGPFLKMLNRAAKQFETHRESAALTRSNDAFWRFACTLTLASACREDEIHHLHAHYADTCAAVARDVWRLTGVPYSFTGHAKDIFTSKTTRLECVINDARFVLGCSEAGVEHMKTTAPATADRIHLVHHGLMIEQWNPVNMERHGSMQPEIIAIGRLTPKKGFDVLLKALADMRTFAPCCTIYGEGRERERLEMIIRELNLADRVGLPGKVDQMEIRRAFERAPIMAVPSVVLDDNNQDGLANVLLEAMACGLAVVASDIPAFREILIHDRNAIVVPAGDVTGLANALAELIPDVERRVRLGRAARESVENLTCARAADTIEGLLDHYVGNK